MSISPERETTVSPIIGIWNWSLDRPVNEASRFWETLSSDEKARAKRYVRTRDTARYIVGRGELRRILGDYLHLAPQALTFSYNDFGKPALNVPNCEHLEFNLSHSAGVAVLAISDRFLIGIDVEEEKPLNEDIAARFFSRTECAALSAVAPDLYLSTFYRIWTRKEAFVKAHGAGLSLPLDSFDVPLGQAPGLPLERLETPNGNPLQWTLYELEVPPGFHGAVAIQSGGASVRLRYETGLM